MQDITRRCSARSATRSPAAATPARCRARCRPMVDAAGGRRSSTTSGTSAARTPPAPGAGSPRSAPRRGRRRTPGTTPHQLRRAGAGAGAQLRDAALVVAGVRPGRVRRRPEQLHGERVRRRFDPMGGGCRHMNAWQKAYQGWFGGCNGVRVTNSGTFNLVPFERRCNGVAVPPDQGAASRAPFMRPAGGGGGRDHREPRLLLPRAAHAARLRRHARQRRRRSLRTVLVHVADDLHARTERGVHTFLLDMKPSTTSLHRRGPRRGSDLHRSGRRPQHHDQSLSASGATITVSYSAGQRRADLPRRHHVHATRSGHGVVQRAPRDGDRRDGRRGGHAPARPGRGGRRARGAAGAGR